MAILIPEIPRNCTNSERLVYERLGRELPDEWIVIHSLGLASHEKKIWGEADIVVLSNLGFFALEIKGGAVECVDGVWSFSGGGFPTFTKKESPWQQASGTMFAIKKALVARDSRLGELIMGFGVVMPFTAFTSEGPEIIQSVLLDKRRFSQPIEQYISLLATYWELDLSKKHGHMYRQPTLHEVRRARQILRPDLETAFSLGGYLTGLDAHLLQLTNQQIRASRRTAANPRTVVRGAAGTGKSVIAVERASQLSNEGKKVLFLCFNELLATHVRSGLAADPRASNVEVRHAHELYRELILNAGLLSRLDEYDPSEPAFFREVFPELAAEALCESPVKPWDVLVVDEAQDLLTPQHLDVWDLLLDNGIREGRWHFFLDPLQNIYGVEVQEAVEERLKEAAAAIDDLFENCRNTRQVATQASIVSGIDLAIEGAPDGPECQVHLYSVQNNPVDALERLVKELLHQDVNSGQIAILSTRRHENSLLRGKDKLAGRRLVQPREEKLLNDGGLLLTTMHAFKGLEKQVVIAIDLEEIGQEHWAMLHYAGLSRARALLHILLPESSSSAYAAQAQKYGKRIKSRLA